MKKINWEAIVLIFLFIVFLISFRSEHKHYIRFENHKKEIFKENMDRVKDIGTYYNVIKDNVSKLDTIKVDSIQKLKLKDEKVN